MIYEQNLPATEDLEVFSKQFQLADDEVATLAPYLKVLDIAAGTSLWEEGDSSNYMAFILAGHVEEKKTTEFAGKQFVVGVYGDGALVGIGSLLDKMPHPLSAVCLEQSRLLILPVEGFGELQKAHPQLAIEIFQRATRALSIRLNKAFDRMAAIF